MHRNTNPHIPRTDVGSSTLIALFAAFLLQLLDGRGYDFDLWAGVIGAALVFVGGYVPVEHKNSYMSLVAVATTALAMLAGFLFYDQPLDNTVLSYAIAAFLVAGLGYALPPNAQSEVIADAGAGGPTRGAGEPQRAQP